MKIRTYISPRDNLYLYPFASKLDMLKLIDLKYQNEEEMFFELIKNEIHLFIQIAPQWEWGKNVEIVSKKIMDLGILLLSGEGAMFRRFGENHQCGADVGFYLSPWGYSGNSKIAYELTNPTKKDKFIADKIMSYQKKWDRLKNNGKILVAGQLDNDRSHFYTRNVNSNKKLILNLLQYYNKEEVVFRKHPQDLSDYSKYGILLENSGEKIGDIIHNYAGYVSINSTSSIEAMCSGVPIFNFEIAPWSSCKVVTRNLTPQLISYDYSLYADDIAKLVHFHFVKTINYGNPILNCLNFYTEYNPEYFNFNCVNRAEQGMTWNENNRNNKY